MDRLLEQRFDSKDKALNSSEDSIVSTKISHLVENSKIDRFQMTYLFHYKQFIS